MKKKSMTKSVHQRKPEEFYQGTMFLDPEHTIHSDLVTRGGFAPRFLDISLFEGRISDFKLE